MKEQYARILDVPRPEPIHPRMDLVNRANIFSSFDALRGFDFAIMTQAAAHQQVDKEVLSPDQENEMCWKLAMLRPGDPLTVTWFTLEKKAGDREMGHYTTETMTYLGVDMVRHVLQTQERSIPLGDVSRLEADLFEQLREEEPA